MPADLDQFGGNDSHGAVIGGKSLVQLGHGAPNGRGFFDKIDVETGFGQIQGGLHTGDAAADHHHGSNSIIISVHRVWYLLVRMTLVTLDVNL